MPAGILSDANIVELGLARKNDRFKTDFSEEPKGGDPDINRMLDHDNKFWQTTAPVKTLEKKKLVITDWSLLYNRNPHETVMVQLLVSLLKSGVELFSVQDNKLVAIHTPAELYCALDKIEPIHKDRVVQLANSVINADNLEIVDYFRLRELLRKALTIPGLITGNTTSRDIGQDSLSLADLKTADDKTQDRILSTLTGMKNSGLFIQNPDKNGDAASLKKYFAKVRRKEIDFKRLSIIDLNDANIDTVLDYLLANEEHCLTGIEELELRVGAVLPHKLQDFLHRLPNLKHLKLRCYHSLPQTFLDDLCCPHLETLELSGANAPKKSLISFLNKSPGLKDLKLQNIILLEKSEENTNFPFQLPHLRSLDLMSCNIPTFEFRSLLASETLEELLLNFREKYAEDNILVQKGIMPINLQKLKVLRVMNCPSLNTIGLESLLEQAKQLEKLDIVASHNDPEQSQRENFSEVNLAHLKRFRLLDADITIPQIRNLLEHTSQLEELAFDANDPINFAKELRALLSCLSLQHLKNLGLAHLSTDAATLNSLLGYMPNLEMLMLSACSFNKTNTDNAMDTGLNTTLAHLKNLTIENLHAMIQSDFLHLVSKMPQLESLRLAYCQFDEVESHSTDPAAVNLPNLLDLHLNRPNLDITALKLLLGNARKLEQLTLCGCLGLDNEPKLDELNVAPRLSALRELNVSDCPNIWIPFLQNLVEQATRLESLKLQGIPIHEGFLNSANLPLLKELILHDLPLAVQYFLYNLKNSPLEILDLENIALNFLNLPDKLLSSLKILRLKECQGIPGILLSRPKNLKQFSLRTGGNADLRAIPDSITSLDLDLNEYEDFIKRYPQLRRLVIDLNSFSRTDGASLAQNITPPNFPALKCLGLFNFRSDKFSHLKLLKNFPFASLLNENIPEKPKPFVFSGGGSASANSFSGMPGIGLPQQSIEKEDQVVLNNETDFKTLSLTINQYFLDKPNEPHLDERDYRLGVLENCMIDPVNETIMFVPDNSSPPEVCDNVKRETDLLQLYKKEYEQKPSYYLGVKECLLEPGSWVKLPSLSPNDEIIAVESDVPVTLGYHKRRAMYSVMTQEKQDGLAKVIFLLKAKFAPYPTVAYNAANISPYFKAIEFAKNADGSIRVVFNDPAVQEFFQSKSKREILSLIIVYLNSFDSGKSFNKPGIALLNEILHDKKGPCEHRSELFKILAESLLPPHSYEIFMPYSDSHLYGEVVDVSSGERFTVDLGGAGDVQKKIIPVELPPAKSLVETAGTQKAEEADIEMQEAEAQLPEEVPALKSTQSFADYYEEQLDKLKDLPPGDHNILLFAPTPEHVLQLNAALMKYTQQQNKRHFYLDSLGDIKKKCIKVCKDGKYEVVDSPFIQHLQSAKAGDVIAANYSDFKSSYVGFNTMIDRQRKLGTTPIADGVIMVGILESDKAAEMQGDFYSRFSLRKDYPGNLQLGTDLYSGHLSDRPAPLENKDFPPINLYGGESWKQDLLGSIRIEGVDLFLTEGKLVEALKNHAHGLRLINAPWDDREFRLFWSDCMAKKSINFNGETHPIPDDFVLYREEQPYELNGDYTVCDLDPDNQRDWQYALNHATYSRFFNNYECHDKKIFNKDGFLEDFSKAHPGVAMPVLINGELSESQLDRLLARATKLGLSLRFIVPDYLSLPEKMAFRKIVKPERKPVVSQTLDTQLMNHKVSLVTSDDLDFTEATIREHCHIDKTIPVNDKLQYTDIIEKIKCSNFSIDENKLPELSSETGSVIELLKAGKTIAIKGKLSTDFALRISTLFAEPPHLWINGKKEDIPGRLIFITDDNPQLAFAQHHYQHQALDCWPQLEKQFDKEACDRLQDTLRQSKLTQLRYIQLKTMLQSARKNPLVPLFLLDKNHAALLPAEGINEKTEDEEQQRLEMVTSELDDSPFVFVIGPSGTGKTTTIVEKLCEYYTEHRKQLARLSVGMDNLLDWIDIDDKHPDAEKILFLDEANLEQEGAFEIFEGLFNHPPEILIKGKLHRLTDKHKVIFAGNYNDYANREEHDFFKRHPHVVLFDRFTEKFLTQKVMQPLLQKAVPTLSADDREKVIAVLLKIYRLSQAAPENPMLTARNLQMACLRFAIFAEQFGGSAEKIAALAGYEEVSQFPSYDAIKKQIFADENEYENRHAELEKKTVASLAESGFYATKSRYRPLQLLANQLAIRDLKIKYPELGKYGVRGILFEGPSGIGKSAMQEAFLKSKGQPYYQLTPTDPTEMKAKLLKAYHEGAVVIIDELNTLPVEVEILLNALLSGFDLNGNKIEKANKEGFFVIATQNPVTFRNRKLQSAAFENRFLKLGLPDYPRDELIEILNYMRVPDAVKVVDEHLRKVRIATARHEVIVPTTRDLFRHAARQIQQEKNQVVMQAKRAWEKPVVVEEPDREAKVSKMKHHSLWSKVASVDKYVVGAEVMGEPESKETKRKSLFII